MSRPSGGWSKIWRTRGTLEKASVSGAFQARCARSSASWSRAWRVRSLRDAHVLERKREGIVRERGDRVEFDLDRPYVLPDGPRFLDRKAFADDLPPGAKQRPAPELRGRGRAGRRGQSRRQPCRFGGLGPGAPCRASVGESPSAPRGARPRLRQAALRIARWVHRPRGRRCALRAWRGRRAGAAPGGGERTCQGAIGGAEGPGRPPATMRVDRRTALVLSTLLRRGSSG